MIWHLIVINVECRIEIAVDIHYFLEIDQKKRKEKRNIILVALFPENGGYNSNPFHLIVFPGAGFSFIWKCIHNTHVFIGQI